MSCINTSLCIVKTESTQTEGVEIMKERITAGVADADKAVEHKPSERSRWIVSGVRGEAWMSVVEEETDLRLPARAG